jgi:predicted MPP superfamily phosphohydrolase
MKLSNIPAYVLIVLSIYLLGNFYVCLRGIQALPANVYIKAVAIGISVILAVSYFLARALERTGLHGLHQFTYWVGSIWMAALLYFFLIVLLVDIVRLINWGFHFLPDSDTLSYIYLKRIVFGSAIVLVAVLLIYGKWNASHPRIKRLDLSIAKQAGTMKELNIAMVSDIHLGSLFGKNKVKQMVDRINALHPDIIFLVGDMLDEAQAPIFRDNIGEPLELLNAPMGVYAVTGNHEYIGGIVRAVKYIKSLHINLLRDTAILIDNSFYVAGREDKDMGRFTDKIRKPLNDIVKDVNRSLPLILLDHQPVALNQAAENGVDIQLSGHTHHGQFWPFNLIINKIYEVSWGYKLKGNTHIYVSSGYGTWGPPIRIASTPEIVYVKLRFK